MTSEAFKKYIKPESIAALGESEFEEHDLYFMFFPLKPISKENRKILKSLGWQLQRHSRTNKEIWVLDKVDEWEEMELERN